MDSDFNDIETATANLAIDPDDVSNLVTLSQTLFSRFTFNTKIWRTRHGLNEVAPNPASFGFGLHFDVLSCLCLLGLCSLPRRLNNLLLPGHH